MPPRNRGPKEKIGHPRIRGNFSLLCWIFVEDAANKRADAIERDVRERERERERRMCTIKGGQLFIADEAEALEKCKGVEFSLTLRWATTL